MDDSSGSCEYALDLELPFGDFKVTARQGELGATDEEMKEFPEDELKYFKVLIEPRPVSLLE